MKKIVSIIFIALLVISCKSQKERIELNLIKGETYSQKMVSNISIKQDLNGQSFDMNMDIDAKMSYKVIDIQNSVYEIEVQYESLLMKMVLPNGTMEFSSEKEDLSDIVSTLLGVLKNKSFVVNMSKSGKVKEVKNIDKLFANMFDKFPQLTEEQKEQIRSQLMQAYGEKAFKGNLEMTSYIFSESPVSMGDKWTNNTRIESGMAGNMETKYELMEASDEFYVISGNSKIATADKDAYVEANGMPLRYDLTGTMTSSYKVNKKSGWIVDAKISQTMKGTAFIKDNPKLPGGMAIPMTVDNKMTITN